MFTTHNKKKFPLIIEPKSEVERYLNNLIEQFKNSGYIFQQLNQHGSILFRGFDVTSVGDFNNLIQQLKLNLKGYLGGDSPRKKVYNQIYTSTDYPPQYNISMHNEMSFSSDYPNYLFFYCDIQPKTGGETPIVDGRALLKALSPNIVDKFKTKRIKYIMNLHNGNGVGKAWQECFETDDPSDVVDLLQKRNANFVWGPKYKTLKVQEIVNPVIQHPITKEMVFFCQADQWHPSNLDDITYAGLKSLVTETEFYHYCCYGDDTPIDLEYLCEIREKTEILKSVFAWQKGDVMIIDNILTLHGRHSFEGERKIYVAMA